MKQRLLVRFIQYYHLTKFKVDIIVALTAVFGYVIGARQIGWVQVILIFSGGLLVTATAHIINQLIETEYDAKMQRTVHRPLVTGAIGYKEAVALAVLLSLSGLLLLYWAQPYAAFISFISLVMYAFIYTPLKQIHRIAIWIGAIPGALPVLIGYVTATGKIDLFAILLFGFQVLWQLPHFWAIAWLWHDEYQKGGYDLLPVKGGKTPLNAFLIFASAVLLFPVLYTFYHFQFVGKEIFMLMMVVTLFFVISGYRLFKFRNEKIAKELMLASIIYLPVIQILLIIQYTN